MKVSILHYGGENHYLYGLVTGLRQFDDLVIEIVGSDNSEKLFTWNKDLIHRNLRHSIDPTRSKIKKIINLILFYFRLISYCIWSNADIFHIQWETNLFIIDRLLLVPLLKLRKKKVVYTAHNVDNEGRDEKKTLLNKLTIKFFYRQFDAIIAHTPKIKNEIEQRFKIASNKIEIIPHGINIIPKSGVSKEASREFLNINSEKKVLLCFGAIEPYKGIDILINSLKILLENDKRYFLIIAGRSLNKNYFLQLDKLIKANKLQLYIKFDNKFIPDNEIEYYFRAADCLVLPYKAIYQSGVLFLSYSFGLPVIATRVGNFENDILEGKTGLLSEKNNPNDLANKIENFYQSNLFLDANKTREFIINYAKEKYSWEKIGELTYKVYQSISKN